MAGEALPIEAKPPEPSVGAIIKPKASVKTGPNDFFFDVDDEGVATVTVQHKRQRKTGRTVKDPDGEDVDEYEGYKTPHTIQVTPGRTPTAIDDTPASMLLVKMIKRRHAAQMDEDGKVIKEAWEEDVPYERPVPRKRRVHFGTDYNVDYEFHDRMLKETIRVKKPRQSVRSSFQLNGMKLKRVPGTDSFKLFTDDNIDLGVTLQPPTGEDAGDKPLAGIRYFYTKEGQLNVVIPEGDWVYPLTIDPSFTFDGTDFVISSSETEIKTYQQLWTLGRGTNSRYNAGFMAADTDGVTDDVRWLKTLASPEDFSELTDLTIDIKTTNADGSWNLDIIIGSGASHYIRWRKSLSGDINTTYTRTDFTEEVIGSPDMENVDIFYIRFEACDSGLAANVVCEVKDYKWTRPTKTSDMYDTTGRFLIQAEDFEGDDGLPIDQYKPLGDASVGYATGGTSLIEIDTAQFNSGTSSCHLFCDGTNNAIATVTTPDLYDYMRMEYMFRFDSSDAGTWAEIDLKDGPSHLSVVYIGRLGAGVRIYYGDGGASNNIVDVNVTINTWHKITVDVDLTNDKHRVWINDVLYPGPNANAGGWDNFFSDGVGVALDDVTLWMRALTAKAKNVWIDDLKFYTGFEDFSALTAPHSVDEITEAVSPSGTDYGRGTQDGDWIQGAAASVAVDNTTIVIGTNSIKYTTLPSGSFVNYTHDSAINISNMTRFRFYVMCSAGTTIRFRVRDSGSSQTIEKEVTVLADKWQFIDEELIAGSADLTDIIDFRIRQMSGGNADLWIDGLHFYGDPAAGTEWHEHRLDFSNNSVVQEGPMYNFGGFTDTGAGDSHTYTATMSSATDNLNIEFGDFGGVIMIDFSDPGACRGTFSLTGFDEDNHIVWSPIGGEGATPTNYPILKSPLIIIDFTYCTFDYVDIVQLGLAGSSFFVYDVFIHARDLTFTLFIYAGITLFSAIKLKLRNYVADADGLEISDSYKFKELDVLSSGAGEAITIHTASEALFINSTFDETDIDMVHADSVFVSKYHNKNSFLYILATGTNGKAYSDLEAAYPGHLPTPSDNFELVKGQLTCGTDAQKFLIHHLASAAGTTIIINCEDGMVVFNPNLDDVLGTLTQNFPLKVGIRIPIRPVLEPYPRPVLAYDA